MTDRDPDMHGCHINIMADDTDEARRASGSQQQRDLDREDAAVEVGDTGEGLHCYC